MTNQKKDSSQEEKVVQASTPTEGMDMKSESGSNPNQNLVEDSEAEDQKPSPTGENAEASDDPSEKAADITQESDSAGEESTKSQESDQENEVVDTPVSQDTAKPTEEKTNNPEPDSDAVEVSPAESNIQEATSVGAPKEEEKVPETEKEEVTEVAQSQEAEKAKEDQKEDQKEEEEESEEEVEEDESLDIDGLDKAALVKLIKEKVSAAENLQKIERQINEIKAAFEEITNSERSEALENYKSEGGVEDDFDFRPSEEEREFKKHYFEFKAQLNTIRKEAEKQKEKNLQLKQEILERLRESVDGEETTLSINTIKEIQKEWKAIGQVPASQNRNLWASYNALMDRFYDNRSIYFELKELDRKKNLESKQELVKKAEELKSHSDLQEAIRSLNDLHDEFKHIGPVPREEQEPLWQQFKAASDAIYDRRKEYYDSQKEVFQKNQLEKEALIEKLKEFTNFKGERIREWNSKTKEILEIQKSWEKIGPVPREKGKEINRAFWSSFKEFFNHKNLFFKELDDLRASNAEKAEELIKQAVAIKESTEWQQTAQKLISLQKEWKSLGPVPEKKRDSLYGQFKEACDFFFENRRNANKQANSEYEENFQKKLDVCAQIEKASAETASEEEISDWVKQFNEIGFVPRKNMKDIQAKFKTAVDSYLDKLPGDFVREEFLFKLNLDRIQHDPNANRVLNKKEHGIRMQIADLENNITLWKNNLEFFAASKTADKLRDQFDEKIKKAEEEIDKLKKKLSILREF